MSLAPPPPRRSRRERMRLPSGRLVLIASAVIAVLFAVGMWEPWQKPHRKHWSAAPQVPARPTAAERAWLTALAGWISFVRDAAEDPTSLTVQDCGLRLAELGPAPARMQATRSLARDTCAAYAAQASDRAASQLSWDAGRAGQANDEAREANRNMRLLIASLDLRAPPGGRVVAEYSRIASRLSGRDVTARCWNSDANWGAVERSLARTEPGLSNVEGFAVQWLSRIELSPGVCRKLAAVVHGSRPPDAAEVNAIEVLTHEAEHLVGPDGNADEAAVDCHAAQHVGRTARMLGVPARMALPMGHFYLTFLQSRLPPEYRSAECRGGGRYDLTPRDGSWP